MGPQEGTGCLPQFTTTTVDDVVASAGRLRPSGQIAEGSSRHRQKTHTASPVVTHQCLREATQANAEAIIRSTLQNPARTFYGDTVIDVYNAVGQAFDLIEQRTPQRFLEAARADTMSTSI